MDCRVKIRIDGSVVEPLLARFRCDLGAVYELMRDDVPWSDDGTALLAFDAEEERAIPETLDKLHIEFTRNGEDQPDAELLAKLQGKVNSRSEALAALESGKVPTTMQGLEQTVEDLNQRVVTLEAAKAEP